MNNNISLLDIRNLVNIYSNNILEAKVLFSNELNGKIIGNKQTKGFSLRTKTFIARTYSHTMRVQQVDFNPLCRVTESAIDGSLMVKMMLRGNIGVQQTHDEFLTLKRYIDGWLFFKEKRKYEKFWFVLKGQVMGGGHLVSAFLFCFKDQNTHVKDHFVGSTQISFPEDTIELHKMEGNEMKPWRCDFVIKLNGEKMHFRAVDNITRDRWIYALVELVGRQLPPQELPALDNSIRPRETKFRNSISRLPEKIKKGISTSYPENGAPRSPRHSMPNIGSIYSPSPVAGTAPMSPLVRSINNPPEQTTSNGVRKVIKNGNIISPDRRATVGSVQSLQRSATYDSPLRPTTLQYTYVPQPGLDSRVDVQWYYGKMGREQAESILDSQPIGTYLLRDCQSKSGCFTLTYKDHAKKKNHMITPLTNGQYQFNGSEIQKTFPSPQEGVLFYMEMKKSGTFHPRPFLFRSPGDGAEEDSSYLQTEDINRANDYTTAKLYQNRPPMLKSPSLPDCAKPPVRRVVSNPQPLATAKQRHPLRKQSNIELPTHNREQPMRRTVSLEDYEQMQPALGSGSQSCTSIPEDDNDAYLTGEEIEATISDDNRQNIPSTSDSQLPYINSSIMEPINPRSPIRKSYNPPLPPIPDTTSGAVPVLPSREDNGYLEMGPSSETQIPEYRQPYPPPDYDGRDAPTYTLHTDEPYLQMGPEQHQIHPDQEPYLQMHPENAEYLTTGELGLDAPDTPDGYCDMSATLTTTTTTPRSHPNMNNNTKMVIPHAPKSPIKKSTENLRYQQHDAQFKRQQTFPLAAMTSSMTSRSMDNDKYVNDLAMLMLTKNKPKNNNTSKSSTAAPPPLPPRLAQPQMLANQSVPNN